MKISKSKKELARIISDNGGWRDGVEFFASTCNGIVIGSKSKPKYTSKYGWVAAGGFIDDRIELHSYLKNWHQTILSREEYFHLYPGLDADGWIEWKGGECPVQLGTLVDVKYANGITNIGVSALTDKTHAGHTFGTAGSLLATNWSSGLPMSGIIAYRLHKPERENPESCEPVMSALIGVDMASGSDSTALFTVNAKPTIEQLSADYHNAKDYAERKQKEADAAKADVNTKLKALEIAGEALGLIVSPITEKQEPELVITDWRDLMERDVIWFDGDDEQAAGEYSVLEVEHANYGGNRAIRIDTIGNDYWIDVTDDWKFIRRP